MRLKKINQVDSAQARGLLLQCCTSTRWVERMLAARPYASARALRCQADAHWRALDETDYLEAFAGHPKIGAVKPAQALAASEQAGVNNARAETINRLALGNRRYQQKFGFIFIVCATGKSAEQMVELLEARLLNNRRTELASAAEEQRKIFHLRLNQLLERLP